MILFADPEQFDFERTLSPDFVDLRFLRGIFGKLPERFAEPVAGRYRVRYGEEGQQAANSWLREEVAPQVTEQALSLSASDAEVCEYAKRRAEAVRGMLARATLTDTGAMRGQLVAYAEQHRATLPKDCTLRGIIARLTDAAYWRRQVRRTFARDIEQNAIAFGLVHRRAGLYASDETTARHAEQRRRNAQALAETEATNEEGQTFTLAELAKVGTSNPELRRAELMTRISGFEDFAVAADHVGMFYTCTAPSRMHARLSKSGQENPKYDGTTPKQCAAYMAKTWAKARAWLHRREVHIYGFRVAEPHHDGTPHWHMLLFMAAHLADCVTECLRRYFCEADPLELNNPKARAARFNAKEIDRSRGSAAGYIAKYIAKNIDGSTNAGGSVGSDYETDGEDAKDTSRRVLAWSTCWGIRQFQQIGGPGVTIWRELRRLREVKQGELFDTWSAADAGNWHAYCERMGGVECARADRRVQLWREALPGKENRYHEPAAPEVCGVTLNGVGYETRLHTWEIKRTPLRGSTLGAPDCRRPAAAGGFDLAPKAPWTRVNNCTRSGETVSKKDMDGFDIGQFSGQPPPKPIDQEARAAVKAAHVAAVVRNIETRRKRGAFGQFPALPVI